MSGDAIEFGCGYGTFTIVAAQRTLGTVYALDPKELKLEQDRPLSEFNDEELTAVLDSLRNEVECLEQAGSNEVNGNSSVEALGAIHGTEDDPG